VECEVCGNQSEDAFEVVRHVGRHTFDTFECAIYAMAPKCAHCGVRIIGHPMERDDHAYCCSHCADAGPEEQAKPEGGPTASDDDDDDDESDDDDDDDDETDDDDDDDDEDEDEAEDDDEDEDEAEDDDDDDDETEDDQLKKLDDRISQARQSADDLLSSPEDEADQDEADVEPEAEVGAEEEEGSKGKDGSDDDDESG
jgi:hypothetical protein